MPLRWPLAAPHPCRARDNDGALGGTWPNVYTGILKFKSLWDPLGFGVTGAPKEGIGRSPLKDPKLPAHPHR